MEPIVEVVIGECGIEDHVAVVFQIGRLAATGQTGPAVEEEDFHLVFDSKAAKAIIWRAQCSERQEYSQSRIAFPHE